MFPARAIGFLPYAYKIESDNGFVVSRDIAELRLLDAQLKGGNRHEDDVMALYVDNINIPNFKKFFSTYCATFFNSPQDAIHFFMFYRFDSETANFWGSIDSNDMKYKHGEETDQVILKETRRLFAEHHVYPPICPEFQYEDKVVGQKVNSGGLLDWRQYTNEVSQKAWLER